MSIDKNRIPLVITIILILFGLIAIGYLLCQGVNQELKKQDMISNIIQVCIGVGGLVSVTYLISSYRHTNKVFILSQKPHLLLYVNNQEALEKASSNEASHVTAINYKNESNNPFYDLSLLITLSTPKVNLDLSDLFTKNMYMAAHDSRERVFFTVEELKKRGIDLISVVDQHQLITLSLEYKFTFDNKEERIKVQEYYWDTNGEEPYWTIK